ncbi:MAG TPA: hypothetical protein VF789_13030 [Thermoanaerobaculia bacterium]
MLLASSWSGAGWHLFGALIDWRRVRLPSIKKDATFKGGLCVDSKVGRPSDNHNLADDFKRKGMATSIFWPQFGFACFGAVVGSLTSYVVQRAEKEKVGVRWLGSLIVVISGGAVTVLTNQSSLPFLPFVPYAVGLAAGFLLRPPFNFLRRYMENELSADSMKSRQDAAEISAAKSAAAGSEARAASCESQLQDLQHRLNTYESLENEILGVLAAGEQLTLANLASRLRRSDVDGLRLVTLAVASLEKQGQITGTGSLVAPSLKRSQRSSS